MGQSLVFGPATEFTADKKGMHADSHRWVNAVPTVPGSIQRLIVASFISGRTLNIFVAGSFLFSALILLANPLFAAELRCPPRMPAAHPGFEQSGPVPAGHWRLRRMRVFDSRPGGAAQSERAPDSTIQRRDGTTSIWRLTLTGDLLMVCIYDGAGTYYYARAEAQSERCVLDNDNGLTRAWCE
jgi:hypothetical protein